MSVVDVPIVLDVEASGFGAGSYPIEVGFVFPDGASHCTLVRPLTDWNHWDDDAQSVHGISRELLQVHGRDAGEVALWLNDHLAGKVVYSDGWAQDNAWIGRLFDDVGVLMRFRIETIRYLLCERQLAHWQRACRQASSSIGEQRHRASADARVVQQAYLLSRDWRDQAAQG